MKQIPNKNDMLNNLLGFIYTKNEKIIPIGDVAAVQAEVGRVQDFGAAAPELHEVGVGGSDGLEDGIQVAVLGLGFRV